jgi:RsmE family RNA methyltransferase
VNLLLVERDEVAADGRVRIADRRAQHLRDVLGVRLGQHVRAGVIGGGVGTAEVLSDDGAAYELRLALTAPANAPLPIELVLAVPRPKVLTRVLETAAAFGVARIDLTNAWRVDKSYLASPRLAPDALADALRLGAEQGATTHLPPISVHARLMHLLDARWPADPPAGARAPTTRLIAHPDAPPIERVELAWPLVLAIGPEGGWIQRELDTFVARGFALVSIGAPILRVEAAVAAALGQLLLLQRRVSHV